MLINGDQVISTNFSKEQRRFYKIQFALWLRESASIHQAYKSCGGAYEVWSGEVVEAEHDLNESQMSMVPSSEEDGV